MTGKTNLYLAKAIHFLDRLSGHSTRAWKVKSDIISEASKKGITPKRAADRVKVESGRSFQTRAKTGIVAGTVGAAGFLGVHKYHQHQDGELMKKIDSMYRNQDDSKNH